MGTLIFDISQQSISPQYAGDHYNALKKATVQIMAPIKPYNTSNLVLRLAQRGQQLSRSKVRSASNVSNEKTTTPWPKSEDSKSAASPLEDSSMIAQENTAEGMVSHRPDFHAPIDHMTS